MFRHSLRGAAKSLSRASSSSSSSSSYTFSDKVFTPPLPTLPRTDALRKGKGLMEYVNKTLPSPEKQKLLTTLFARRGKNRVLPGSVITVSLEHPPYSFSGVLLAIRRRGPDTSFLLRNVILGTAVEMQFFVNSPILKEIKVVQKAGKGQPVKSRRAKFFFLRNSPEKMTAIAGGIKV